MDPRIQLELWNVYAAQDLDDRALEAANTVPAASPLFRRARFAVAQSLIALKRFDGAMHELDALYKAEPSAAVSNALGIVQLRRGPAEGTNPSTMYFARAVREAPANTTYLFNLGYAHALASNNPEALTSLRETVRLDPTDGDAHLVMSAVLGKTPEGQRELELARSLGRLARSEPGRARRPGAGRPRTSGAGPWRFPGGPAGSGAPPQRDQQETAAFHLGPGANARRSASRHRGHRGPPACDLPLAVRRRAAPAPRHALPKGRPVAGGHRRVQDRDLVS